MQAIKLSRALAIVGVIAVAVCAVMATWPRQMVYAAQGERRDGDVDRQLATALVPAFVPSGLPVAVFQGCPD